MSEKRHRHYCKFCNGFIRHAMGNAGVLIHEVNGGRLCPKSEPVPGKKMRVQKFAVPIDDGVMWISDEQEE